MKNTLFFVQIILLFFIIGFSSFFLMVYDLNYYDSKYEKYNIYEIFEKDTALRATNNLFGFFQSRNNLDMNFFNQTEASHLLDVKILIQKAWLIYLASIFLFVLILIYKYGYSLNFTRYLGNLLLMSGLFSIGLLLLIALIFITAGFGFLFNLFHEVFFIENYAFNPNVSNMKALYPDAFFLDFTIDIVFRLVIAGAMMIVFGIMIWKIKSNRKT